MRHSSSVDLPRIGGDDSGRSVRLLRLKADARTRQMLRASVGPGDAFVDVPSRASVVIGERVRVEISFGALSDEVEIDGHVHAIGAPIGNGPATVVLRVDEVHRPRVRYAAAVLDGNRPASARSHRRIPTDLTCSWTEGSDEHRSRMLDLSRGGAFIRSERCPAIGTTVTVRMPNAHGTAIRVNAIVSWVRRAGPRGGFGVSFKLRDRILAQQLHRMVREQERSPAAAQ
jgi:hypothetical protein